MLERFKAYYRSQEFFVGLNNYFNVKLSNDKGYPMVLSMEESFRTGLPEPHYSYTILNEVTSEQRTIEREKSVCFSILFYYASLCNYTIDRLLGYEQLKNFLKAANCPLTSCGLAGICSPQKTLEEADLVFYKQSQSSEKALMLFKEVTPFIKEELNKFFKGESTNLDSEAYNVFCKAIDEKVNDFWEIADPLIDSFQFTYAR